MLAAMPAPAANPHDCANSTAAADPSPSDPHPSTPAESPSPERARIRTLIVDDQLLSRELLRRRLRGEPDIEIIGTAASGREAIDAIRRLRPDLVFLDVQMPDLDGFEVISQFDPSGRPAIIFVTADEEFARQAFDVDAVDYLLKPCGRQRFRLALQRARDQIRRRQADQTHQRLSEWLLHSVKSTLRSAERLAVKSGGRILFLRVADIDWIEAAGHGVVLHAGDQCHPLRGTLAALEARLPTEQFVRVNRSSLVNVERVAELRPGPRGEHAVVLANGTRLLVTRGYRNRLGQLGLSGQRS